MSYSAELKKRGQRPVVSWWRDRWRTKVGGGATYFRHPDTRAGYEDACRDFYAIRDGLKEGGREYLAEIDKLDQLATAAEIGGDLEGATQSRHRVAELRAELAKPNPTPLSDEPDVTDYITPEGRAINADRVRIARRLKSERKTIAKTVGQAATTYCDLYEAQAKSGKIAVGTWDNVVKRLRHFREWASDNFVMDEIDSPKWLAWYTHVIGLDCVPRVQHHYLTAARQWLKWSYRNDWIEKLPKNLDDPLLTINLEDTTPDEDGLWLPSEVKAMLPKLPAVYQVCVALALNCGMTQADVASITHKQLETLRSGRLIHQRKKTRKRQRTPVVNYKLWPQTIRLMKAVISDHDTFAFVSPAGNQIVIDERNEVTGKRKKHDALSAYWTAAKANGVIEDKEFRYLRKTGSTFISEITSGLEDIYLGHASGSMAGKHYNAKRKNPPPYQPLDDATDALGKHFGMTT